MRASIILTTLLASVLSVSSVAARKNKDADSVQANANSTASNSTASNSTSSSAGGNGTVSLANATSSAAGNSSAANATVSVSGENNTASATASPTAGGKESGKNGGGKNKGDASATDSSSAAASTSSKPKKVHMLLRLLKNVIFPRKRRTHALTAASQAEEHIPLTTEEGEANDDNVSGPQPTFVQSHRTPILAAFLLLTALFVLRYTLSPPSSNSRPGPVIRTSLGTSYGGVELPNSTINVWWRIPYAQPPLGIEGRFRAPRRLQEVTAGKRRAVEDATKPDLGCPRAKQGKPGQEGWDGNEDCLNLNVFAPRDRLKGELLPVVVWIHGGGFYGGSPHESPHNPLDLVQKSVTLGQPLLFVTIGYRLNTLGFMSTASPEDDGIDLNVGLKDQLEALEWVQREIVNFGGDKNKVTVGGHSAGAISTGLHQIYSPSHLFRSAILLSGAPTSFPLFTPSHASTRVLSPLLTHPLSPCRSVACLKTLPIDELMELSKIALLNTCAARSKHRKDGEEIFPWSPVTEGERGWLNLRPGELDGREGGGRRMILGAVKDEGTSFTPTTIQLPFLKTALNSSFPHTPSTAWNDLISLYPSASSTYIRLAQILGDLYFRAPIRWWARTNSVFKGGDSVWSYEWGIKRWGAKPSMGVQHGADLKSWFGHPDTSKTDAVATDGMRKAKGTKQEEEGRDDDEIVKYSEMLVGYFLNFVHTGDPNGPGLPDWSPYRPAAQRDGDVLSVSLVSEQGDGGVRMKLDATTGGGVEWITEHDSEYFDR